MKISWREFWGMKLPMSMRAIFPKKLKGQKKLGGPEWPGWRLVWLLPIFVAHLAMNLGLAALVARLAVPFRDVSNLIPFLVRIWLYLSPIIWTLELLESADVPSWLPTLMNFNPMFHFLSVYRTALLGWDFDPGALLGAGIWAVVIVIIGTITFVRFEGRVVQYL